MRADHGVICGDLDPYSVPDMVELARESLNQWSGARARTAAELRAARRLAFAVRRLDSLGALGASPPAAGTAAGG